MIASLAAEGQRTKPAPFGHALAALAETRPEIVGLTADTADLGKSAPDRRLRRGRAALAHHQAARRRHDREAGRTGRMVVVAENHSVGGRLGETVASLLMREGVRPPAFRRVALPDAFLAAGALPTLHDRYGISTEGVNAQHQGLAMTAWEGIGFLGLDVMGLSVAPA